MLSLVATVLACLTLSATAQHANTTSDLDFTSTQTAPITLAPSTTPPASSATSESNRTSIASCPADCSALEHSIKYSWWPATHTTTLTAGTIIFVINNRTNTTKTVTSYNDLPSGFTLPPVNSNGTRITSVPVTGFNNETTMTTITYPTPFIQYPISYEWFGTLLTTNAEGESVCSSKTSLDMNLANPVAYTSYATPAQPSTASVDQDDLLGLSYEINVNGECPFIARPRRNTNDGAFKSCTAPTSLVCPATAVPTAAFLTATATSYDDSPPETSPTTTSNPTQHSSGSGEGNGEGSTQGSSSRSSSIEGVNGGEDDQPSSSMEVGPGDTISAITSLPGTSSPTVTAPSSTVPQNGGTSRDSSSRTTNGSEGTTSPAPGGGASEPSASATSAEGSRIENGQSGGGTTPLTVVPVLTIGSSTVTAVPATGGSDGSDSGSEPGSESANIGDSDVNDNSDSTTSNFIVGSQTLTPGGTITIPASNGGSPTTIHLESGGSSIVVNDQTQTVRQTTVPVAASTTVPGFTLGSSTITAITGGSGSGFGSSFVIGTQTLAPGGVVTISGTAVSLPLSGSAVVVNSQTQTIAQVTVPLVEPPTTAGDLELTLVGQTYTANSATEFTISGSTVGIGSTMTMGSGAAKTTVIITTDSAGSVVEIVNGKTSATLQPGSSTGLGDAICSGLGGCPGGTQSPSSSFTGAAPRRSARLMGGTESFATWLTLVFGALVYGY